MDKYWLGTDINTHLVFLSDGNVVNKFCYWNHNLYSNQITITECKDEVMGHLQVSHTLQVWIKFCENQKSQPKVVYEEYVKDLYSKKRVSTHIQIT